MVSKPLSILINKSLASGIFPNKLKIAKIIPIFKSGDPSSFSNYRPVSILPAFSKVFEKVIYNRLLQHLNENSILYILSSSDSDKSIQPLTQLFNLLTKFLKQQTKKNTLLEYFLTYPKPLTLSTIKSCCPNLIITV